ncbi:unnamed protein product [Ceutorhynchus assimilis]|uniref:Protein sleepless n=1 Tax=Ceutorhynchus assimilis TaxID=467358 RepID=A0A9N9MPK4_9CUCU|nr:unnamed protein product [Ceutorhynchus assimilis]
MTRLILVSVALAIIFANNVLSDSQRCYWCSSIAGAPFCDAVLDPSTSGAQSWVTEETCGNSTSHVCVIVKLNATEAYIYERHCAEATRDGKEFCEYVVDDLDANSTLVECKTCDTDLCNTVL